MEGREKNLARLGSRQKIVAELVIGATLLALGLVGFPVASAAACSESAHGPILIQSDSDFTATNGVVSGSGTAGNPYIIANLQLNDLTKGYGLKVDNSRGRISKFFNVRCIQSSFTNAAPSGSVLIWLLNIHTTTTISDSSTNSAELGGSVAVRLDSSSAITLDNLSINKFGFDGIQLNSSDHITIINTKSKADHNGVDVRSSHDITIGQPCSLSGGSGCNDFTYDNGRGIDIANSHNILVQYTITTADDSGGILMEGSGTYNVMLLNGDANGNGPICEAGVPTGEVVDTISGIAVTTGAHDINVKGYTINANGDGAGGFFDIMNGGNGLYQNPCTFVITKVKQTAPSGSNVDFNGNCWHFEFGFNPVPTSSC